MLVLSRKRSEQVFIGEDVVLTLVRTKGNTVYLGFEAPRSVAIVRSELTAGAKHSKQTLIRNLLGLVHQSYRAYKDKNQFEKSDLIEQRLKSLLNEIRSDQSATLLKQITHAVG